MTTEIAQKNLTDKLAGLKQAPSTKTALQNLKAQERLDKVLIILLDTSGSMTECLEHYDPTRLISNQTKINVAWSILHTQLMPNLANWNYGIICFSDSAYWKVYPIGSTTALATSPPLATGQTAMGQVLNMAWNWVKGHAKEARFILLSDGMPNDIPKEMILGQATENRNIPIDSVGIGTPGIYSYDPEFLKQLSDITGGMFSEVDSVQLLGDTIKKLSPKERPLLGEVKDNQK